jgi:hypothetical protein
MRTAVSHWKDRFLLPSWSNRGSNSRKRVGEGPGKSDCGICKRSGGRKPIPSGYVRPHGEGDSVRALARTSPDDREKAKGCNEFTKKLRWVAANVLRQREDWETKHEVRRDGSGHGSRDLSEHIVRGVPPSDSKIPAMRESSFLPGPGKDNATSHFARPAYVSSRENALKVVEIKRVGEIIHA